MKGTSQVLHFWMFKMSLKHPRMFRPLIYKLPIQAYQQTMYVRKMSINLMQNW